MSNTSTRSSTRPLSGLVPTGAADDVPDLEPSAPSSSSPPSEEEYSPESPWTPDDYDTFAYDQNNWLGLSEGDNNDNDNDGGGGGGGCPHHHRRGRWSGSGSGSST